jgi:hypothetical protein
VYVRGISSSRCVAPFPPLKFSTGRMSRWSIMTTPGHLAFFVFEYPATGVPKLSRLLDSPCALDPVTRDQWTVQMAPMRHEEFYCILPLSSFDSLLLFPLLIVYLYPPRAAQLNRHVPTNSMISWMRGELFNEMKDRRNGSFRVSKSHNISWTG